MPIKLPTERHTGPKKPFDPRGILSILFIVVGLVILSNLLNMKIPYLSLIPEMVQMWVGALGCLIGGLYMLYRRMTREKLVVS